MFAPQLLELKTADGGSPLLPCEGPLLTWTGVVVEEMKISLLGELGARQPGTIGCCYGARYAGGILKRASSRAQAHREH